MNNTRGFTLTELIIAIVVGTIVLGIAAMTIAMVINIAGTSRTDLTENSDWIVANTYIHDRIRSSAYCNIEDGDNLLTTRDVLELYDGNGVQTAYFDNDATEHLTLRNPPPDNSIIEEFVAVSATFSNADPGGGTDNVTEVVIDYAVPFANVAYVSCRVDWSISTTWAAYIPTATQTGLYIPYSVIQTSDQGYVIVGRGEGHDAIDAFVLKLDKRGELEWSRCLFERGDFSSYDDYAVDVVELANGDLLIVGETETARSGLGEYDMFLVKMDANGNIMPDGGQDWARIFGGTEYEIAYSIQATYTQRNGTPDGYIIAGLTTPSIGQITTASAIYLVRTNLNGKQLWSQRFETSGGTRGCRGYAVEQTFAAPPSNAPTGYIISGTTYRYNTSKGEVHIIKTDINGNKTWAKAFGQKSELEGGTDIFQTSDGGYILASIGKLHLIKIDSNGNNQWSKIYSGSVSHAYPTRDGGYIVSGLYVSGANNDLYLLKVNSSGNHTWSKIFGGAGIEMQGHAVETVNSRGEVDGYILVGCGRSFNGTGRYELIIIRTDTDGNCPEAKSPLKITSEHNGVSVQAPYEIGLPAASDIYPDSWIDLTGTEVIPLFQRPLATGTPTDESQKVVPDATYLAY